MKTAEQLHVEQCGKVEHNDESCCYHIACTFKRIHQSIPLVELLELRAYVLSFCDCDEHCAELMDDNIECIHSKAQKHLTNLTTKLRELKVIE